MIPSLRRVTVAEQTAAHIREGILAGRWSGRLPGVQVLAAQCKVSPITMRAALVLLERENYITVGGAGRCRMVAGLDKSQTTSRPMRVMILLGNPLNQEDVGFQNFLFRLQHELEKAGHGCGFAAQSQAELKHDLGRISRQCAKTPADAWVVTGGSQPVLSWFAQQQAPALAIGGRCMGLPIASSSLSLMPAFQGALRQLLKLGHRRIVFLCPRYMWDHEPSPPITLLFEELAAHGVTASRYNVPAWNETPDGLRDLLDNTFRFTPPTAIITSYTSWAVAVLSFLSQKGLRVPQDVSILCTNYENWFPWHYPTIAHMYGDEDRMRQHIVRWMHAVALGRADHKQFFVPMEFIPGGSIGPAPK